MIICHNLGITHTELMQQPDEWVEKYLIFMNAKGKAEKDKNKRTSEKKD